MKLKTLKDMKKQTHRCLHHRDFCNFICEEELRQSAIEWIKKFETPLTAYEQGTKDFIEHFFNLTEEDLK